MRGDDIFKKKTFEIPHKVPSPYTEICVFY